MITFLLGLFLQLLVLVVLAAIIYIVFRPPSRLPFLNSDRMPSWEEVTQRFQHGDSVEQTVRQMRSRSNALALEAVEQAQQKGWLTSGDLEGATLRLANLHGANLQGAHLAGANLSYANLTNVQLADAKLVGADLTYANLQQANLDRADLRRASLPGVDLDGASLVGTLYSNDTVWPKGFDITTTEAINVDALIEQEQRKYR